MIYLSSLALCLCLAWCYDILGCKKNKNVWYNILLVWFIFVSGFQYMVGTDIPIYVEKYQNFHSSLSIDTFSSFSEDRQQPGWVMLTWLCRHFSDNFLLLKIVQASFFNIAIFSFFKRESKYIFLCVFFYAISIYLVTNFNVLRQSFAVAFGLYATSAIKNNKYVNYLLFVFMAFMFHNSALLLLIIPLFKWIKLNKLVLALFLSGIVIGVYVLINVDFESLALSFLEAGSLGDGTTAELASGYLYDEKLGAIGRSTGLSIHVILIMMVVLYYLTIKKDFFIGGFGVAYLFIVIITGLMPILWRFRLYFDIPYYVLLSTVIIEYPKVSSWRLRHIFYIIALILYCYYPYRDYSAPQYSGSKLRYINQYYPYHSIFDPVIEKRI